VPLPAAQPSEGVYHGHRREDIRPEVLERGPLRRGKAVQSQVSNAPRGKPQPFWNMIQDYLPTKGDCRNICCNEYFQRFIYIYIDGRRRRPGSLSVLCLLPARASRWF
jgi:hypothetical protein